MPSVESHAEEVIAALGVLEQVRQHQADTDAFVIACFGDTGVPAAREVATCPVVGMTEAALQTACLVAHRFVVITLPARTIAHSRPRRRARSGSSTAAASIAVDVPVADLVDGSDPPARRVRRRPPAAAIDDGPGRGGRPRLRRPGRPRRPAGATRWACPVIDGVAAAVGIAAGLVAMGLNTSRANTFAAVPGC